jgi:hypothetical protein
VEYIDCPLCANETHTPQDPFSIFVAGDATMTCQTAFDLGPVQLPKSNCTFWQRRGETICQCAAEPPPRNLCTLCQNGKSLPDPFLEVLPGMVCAELQLDARRDDPTNCVLWQQTYGFYCGCDNDPPMELNICRLCGDTSELLDPMASTFENGTFSCGEAEFDVNLPENDSKCDEYISIYANRCCSELPTSTPSTSPTTLESGGVQKAGLVSYLVFGLVTLF